MTSDNLIAKSIWRNKRSYFTSTVCFILSVFLFTCFSVILFHPYLPVVEGGFKLYTVISGCLVFLFFFSAILIFNAMKMETARRARSYGIMRTHGGDYRILKDFIADEYMRISIFSIIVGIIAGVAYSPVGLSLVRKIIGSERFQMYVPVKAVILTLVLYFILSLLLSRVIHRFITSKKLKELLEPRPRINNSPIKHIVYYVVGVISFILLLCFIYSYYTKSLYYDFLKGDYGVLSAAIVFLIAVYFFIHIIFREFVVRMIKSKYYKQGLGMVVFSDLRNNIKRDTNVVFILSVILFCVFVFTSVLFSRQKEVLPKIESKYVYDYFYIHNRYNMRQIDKANFIDSKLNEKKGYQYRFNQIYYDYNNPGIGLIDHSSYYTLAKMAKYVPKEQYANELLFVYGSSAKGFDYVGADELGKKFLKDTGLENYKIKKVYSPITPRGLYEGVFVMNTKQFEKMDKSKLGAKVMNAYVVDDWNTDFRTAYKISDEVTDGSTNKEGFYTASLEYQEETIVKNLLFYVGLVISLCLIVATELVLHFNMLTRIEQDKHKYRTLYRNGFSFKSIRSTIFIKNFILMYIPYIISGIFLLISIFIYGNSLNEYYDDAVINILLIFFTIYTLGYLFMSVNYSRRIKKLVVKSN